MEDFDSLSHVRWQCKYHVVFIPKYRRKVLYEELRASIGRILRDLCEQMGIELLEGHALHFWAVGYWVSTVGRDEEGVRKYIREQESRDRNLGELFFKTPVACQEGRPSE